MDELTVESNREENRKRKTSLFGLGLIASILFIRLLSEIFVSKISISTAYITLSSVFLFTFLFIYVKKTRHYKNATFLAILSSFVFIFMRTNITGGLSSSEMSWYPILPIISSLVLSKNKTYLISIISILVVIFTYFWGGNFDESTYSPLSNVFTYISVIIMSTMFSSVHENRRKKMQIQIENQRLSILSASRNTELGELAAGIAHEINNPLTVVSIKAIKIKELVKNDSEATKSIDKIILMTNRISSIVTSMKNLSKSSTYDTVSSRESFNDILKNVLPLCETKINYSQIDFKLVSSIEDREKYKLPILIGHVLLNLINNAYDAIHDKDQSWILVTYEKVDDRLEIRISNSGKKITDENAQKIFNPFFTDKAKSTGLGLSISKNNITSIGGNLYLDSKSDKTTFVISLKASDYICKDSIVNQEV